ncbi:hypothetical protein T03_2360 [Trichinella britovi]|uniref:Uncharacterized protein n=1 Tax=Trichinella britovi TaxID=45882 RepID=A0A0V1CGI1_TRIBR|nr:hypothetical protein T03_2360 [Trichinella britovi]
MTYAKFFHLFVNFQPNVLNIEAYLRGNTDANQNSHTTEYGSHYGSIFCGTFLAVHGRTVYWTVEKEQKRCKYIQEVWQLLLEVSGLPKRRPTGPPCGISNTGVSQSDFFPPCNQPISI